MPVAPTRHPRPQPRLLLRVEPLEDRQLLNRGPALFAFPPPPAWDGAPRHADPAFADFGRPAYDAAPYGRPSGYDPVWVGHTGYGPTGGFGDRGPFPPPVAGAS